MNAENRGLGKSQEGKLSSGSFVFLCFKPTLGKNISERISRQNSSYQSSHDASWLEAVLSSSPAHPQPFFS